MNEIILAILLTLLIRSLIGTIIFIITPIIAFIAIFKHVIIILRWNRVFWRILSLFLNLIFE